MLMHINSHCIENLNKDPLNRLPHMLIVKGGEVNDPYCNAQLKSEYWIKGNEDKRLFFLIKLHLNLISSKLFTRLVLFSSPDIAVVLVKHGNQFYLEAHANSEKIKPYRTKIELYQILSTNIVSVNYSPKNNKIELFINRYGGSTLKDSTPKPSDFQKDGCAIGAVSKMDKSSSFELGNFLLIEGKIISPFDFYKIKMTNIETGDVEFYDDKNTDAHSYNLKDARMSHSLPSRCFETGGFMLDFQNILGNSVLDSSGNKNHFESVNNNVLDIINPNIYPSGVATHSEHMIAQKGSIKIFNDELRIVDQIPKDKIIYFEIISDKNNISDYMLSVRSGSNSHEAFLSFITSSPLHTFNNSYQALSRYIENKDIHKKTKKTKHVLGVVINTSSGEVWTHSTGKEMPESPSYKFKKWLPGTTVIEILSGKKTTFLFGSVEIVFDPKKWELNKKVHANLIHKISSWEIKDQEIYSEKHVKSVKYFGTNKDKIIRFFKENKNINAICCTDNELNTNFLPTLNMPGSLSDVTVMGPEIKISGDRFNDKNKTYTITAFDANVCSYFLMKSRKIIKNHDVLIEHPFGKDLMCALICSRNYPNAAPHVIMGNTHELSNAILNESSALAREFLNNSTDTNIGYIHDPDHILLSFPNAPGRTLTSQNVFFLKSLPGESAFGRLAYGQLPYDSGRSEYLYFPTGFKPRELWIHIHNATKSFNLLNLQENYLCNKCFFDFFKFSIDLKQFDIIPTQNGFFIHKKCFLSLFVDPIRGDIDSLGLGHPFIALA